MLIIILLLLLYCKDTLSMISTSASTIRNNIKILQKSGNGFDIRGEVIKDDETFWLSDAKAYYIGYGFAKYIAKKCQKVDICIGVGRDTRKSGLSLSSYFRAGVEDAGYKAYDVGITSTPSMFCSCSSEYNDNECDYKGNPPPWPFDGAVSITASHLPQKYNGFKLFTKDCSVGIGSDGITSLIEEITEENIKGLQPRGSTFNLPTWNYVDNYIAFLKNTVKRLHPNGQSLEKPLSGLKVCINPGHGVAYFLPKLLNDLGADTTSSIHVNIDEEFPKHVANPEDKIAMKYTKEAVISSNSDIGICLDTDGDRSGIVDFDGRILNRNGFIAVISKIAIKDKGDVIVTDSSTSSGLTKYVESLGGKLIRYKKGYRYVIGLASETVGCVAGFEASGHGGFKNHNWIDDGTYSALRVLIELHSFRLLTNNQHASISDIIKGFHEPSESHEIRLHMLTGTSHEKRDLATQKSLEVLRNVVKNLNNWKEEPVNHEGLRIMINCNQPNEGWLMIRASLHEPILSLQLESESAGGSKEILKQLISNGFDDLEKQNILDLQPIKSFIDT